MKVFFESYNEVFQNETGGIRIKIEQIKSHLSNCHEIKYFDKWNDKISECDILHLFMPNIQNYGLFRLAQSQGKKIIISSVATPESNIKIIYRNVADRIMRNKGIYYYSKYMYSNADRIIAETVYEREFLIKCYKLEPSKVVVIPNGITISSKSIPNDYFSSRTGIKGKFVLQVGRFDRNKNQLSTIKAMNNIGYPLVLIGGPDKDDSSYYELCRKTANKNIHFLGWVDHDDPLLYAAYNECHTFILPSHHEILGNALLEAAAMGANIVSTNVLPLKDWGVDELCLSVNPKDEKEIELKLRESLGTEKNDRVQQIINEKFSWSRVVKDHLNVYESVAEA